MTNRFFQSLSQFFFSHLKEITLFFLTFSVSQLPSIFAENSAIHAWSFITAFLCCMITFFVALCHKDFLLAIDNDSVIAEPFDSGEPSEYRIRLTLTENSGLFVQDAVVYITSIKSLPPKHVHAFENLPILSYNQALLSQDGGTINIRPWEAVKIYLCCVPTGPNKEIVLQYSNNNNKKIPHCIPKQDYEIVISVYGGKSKLSKTLRITNTQALPKLAFVK